MRKYINILLVILLIAILMVLTNPSKDQFIDWAYKKAESNADTQIEKILGDVIGRPLLQISTERNDYLLFSIFKLNKGDSEGVFFGVFRYLFIELK